MTALSTDWQGNPLESRNCESCGDETAVSENTLDKAGFRCTDCRVVAAHRAQGCTHAMTEWCPLRGNDPFADPPIPAGYHKGPNGVLHYGNGCSCPDGA